MKDLEPAEADRLVDVDATAIRFRHPLVARRGLPRFSSGRTPRIHLALATGAGDDIERRAWHRAAAALGPDEEAAADLEAAAGIASARTATIAAAAASERAAALGDGGNVRGRRLYLAAAAAIAGDFPRGVDFCSRALVDVSDASLEFAIRLLRGQMLFVSNGAAARPMLLEEIAALERKNPMGAATLAALAAIDSARTRDFRAASEDIERLERLSARTATTGS